MKFIKQQRETRNIVEIYNGTDPIRPLPVYAKSVDTSISPPPTGAVQIGIRIIQMVRIIYHHVLLIY